MTLSRHETRRVVPYALSGAPTEKEKEQCYIREFCARVQRLREAKGKDWTQAAMAGWLRVEPGTYAKYETRTPLPHYLLADFALITDCSLEYLITGKGARSRK